MRKILHNFILGTLTLTSLVFYGQERKVARADQKFDRLEYVNAIQLYENVSRKGFHTCEMLQNLGDSYYFNGLLPEAYEWYNVLFEAYDSTDIPTEYFYRFSESLKSIEHYAQADAVLQNFNLRVENDRRGTLYSENLDYLKQIEDNSGRYDIDLASVNSVASDFGSTVYDSKLIFASARKRRGVSKNIHLWTGESFTRIYEAEILENGNLGKVKPFANSLNTRFNESTPVFSKDGKTVYFTRNNFMDGHKGISENETTLLKIYRATLEDGKWIDITDLNINGANYSTAHPALSPDEQWLYFASDREGTIGQSDLFKAALLPNGTLGNPINLGGEINTEGRESFPFISANNELYFASDGRPGLGGLDLFVAKINDDGSFGNVHNLGAPANSERDDFAYYINGTTRLGYLSSNRKSEQGKDDIYSFLETRALDLRCTQEIKGTVYDASKSTHKLADVEIAIYDHTHEFIKKIASNSVGEYQFASDELGCGKRIYLKASKEGFLDVEKHVDFPNSSSIQTVDFSLNKKIVEVKKGDDLFKVLQLNPIYFDYDQSEIRPDAALELAKVAEILAMYPNMIIDVRAHTDSRGKDSYNMSLSDRRANSTVQWIIDQGVNGNRISGKGYGESQLINACANGVKCSEEKHQENRRSEFIVIEL